LSLRGFMSLFHEKERKEQCCCCNFMNMRHRSSRKASRY
jgi:hypothetical protein